MKSLLISFAKVAVSLLALWYVLAQADVGAVLSQLKAIHPPAVLMALFFLLFAQMASARRMRYFFAEAGVALSFRLSQMLYFLGMFYNNILPGGIGGDGYKVYWVRKHYGLAVMEGIRLLIAERLNGLFVLGVFFCIALFLMQDKSMIPLGDGGIAALLFVGVFGYLVIAQKFFRHNVPFLYGATLYSIGVQSFTLITALLLAVGMDLDFALAEYAALFLLAAVVGVLPISVGGVGVRELTFFYGAPFLGVDAEKGVALSICWLALYMVISLIGLFFIPALGRPPKGQVSFEQEGI